jgi:methylamine dehydrogenase accessory protein MauD
VELIADVLIASQVVLWCAILLLGAAVFALSRQVARLFNRIPPAGALSVNASLVSGEPAPVLELNDIWGRATVVGGPKPGLSLLFFISLDCPICKPLIPVVQSVALFEGAALVFVSDGGVLAAHRQFAQRAGLADHTYLHSETVGRGFAVGKLPYAVLLDTAGIVLSFGIVNNREHLESLFVARDTGVGTVQEYVERGAE